MYKYIHLVVIAKFGSQSLAYHYASTDGDDVMDHKELLNQQTRVPGYLYGIHMLKTVGTDFKSVQARDPYFDDFEVFESMTDFFDAVYRSAVAHNALGRLWTAKTLGLEQSTK